MEKPAGLLIGLLGKKPKDAPEGDSTDDPKLTAVKALREAIKGDSDTELLSAVENLIQLCKPE